jgi:phytoene desaturase
MAKQKAIIIGSGFGGLGSACLLAKAGWEVTVLEKNEQLGGRASVFYAAKDSSGKWQTTTNTDKTSGLFDNSNKSGYFKFDMGPSWYLMPDIFEHFYNLLGEDVNKHLDLIKLSPSYRIFYKDSPAHVDIYSDLKKDLPTIEKIEKGAGKKLDEYLKKSGYQYTIAKDRFLYKNYDTWRDFLTKEVATEGRKLSVFSNMDRYVRKYFKTDAMQKIMQYPLVFLGSSPYNTPAIYNIMNHIDFSMGVFYPNGGIYEITKSLVKIARSHGAKFHTNSAVSKILVEDGQAKGVVLDNGKVLKADTVISNADMHFTEKELLEPQYRERTEKYWKSRTLAPSALIMYLGVDKQYDTLSHHNLIFSKDWKLNFSQIFDQPQWPDDPSLYVCAPSKTDGGVAPKGHENMFVLVPIAPGLTYTKKQIDDYADKIIATLQKEMKLVDLADHIIYKRIFAVKDFADRYNSYQGTALGLAHTLKQTAIFRPSNISKKVSGLYYVGAGTNPGIGMPITLISAQLMYKRLVDDKSSGPASST